MIKKIYNIFFLYLLIQISTYAQSIHVSGTIFDKETNIPISGVSIFTQDNKFGTISTSNGKFTLELHASKANSYLYFRSIEYETDSIYISQGKNSLSVHLQPKIYSLKEVYVIPDSTLLSLLRKAYNKITDNYPNRPTRYEAFFQNNVINEKGELVELIEAKLAVYKEPYLKKKEMPGQIEILKSRMKQLQDSKVFFMGGAFTPIEEDYVLQRANFIQPQKFNQYKYEFSGIKTLRNMDCYEIDFHPLKKDSDNVFGKIFIETKSFAYILFDIHTEQLQNAKKLFGPIEPVESEVHVSYEEQDGKWYLNQTSLTGKFEHWSLKIPLNAHVDFFALNMQIDSVRPIPFEKRLEYTDLIETKVEPYHLNGWTDSISISNNNSNQLDFQFSNDEALAIFSQNATKKNSSQNEILNLFSHLNKGYGFSYILTSFI